MMTSYLSAPPSTTPRLRVNFFKSQQSRRVPWVQAPCRPSAAKVIRLAAAQSSEPNIPKIELNEVKERLIEVIPEPAKQVPWKNAEKIFVKNLLEAGEKAVKLVFIPLFILSFLSDVLFSILKNKELLIPVGLFVGCTLSDFLNETLKELFRKSELSGSSSSRRLLYISGFFVVTRFLCSSFSLPTCALLMHVANGGLMQVLWLWRNSREASRNNNHEEVSVLSQDTS